MTTLLAIDFQWAIYDTETVIVGALCAAACALPGALLVLRRLSMMGDAISHTVLPGLAGAFLMTGTRDPWAMFLGAVVVGILTALLVEWVQHLGKTDAGASMGVVFTILFAIGVLMIRQAADTVDLDPGCVLYGAIDLTYLKRVEVWGVSLPRAGVVNGLALIVNAVVIALLFKEFRIASFDAAMATSVGISARLMHYLLMAMVAATAVAAFETVGSVLVIAMIVVPGATAFLLTRRLLPMLVLSVLLAVAAAGLGYVSAITLPQFVGFADTSIAGMMAVATGAIFAVAWVATPHGGLVVRFLSKRAVSVEVLSEDVLGLLYRIEELHAGKQDATPRHTLTEALSTHALQLSFALRHLTQRGMLDRDARGYQLTDRGRAQAQLLVRTHRLWETYLVNKLGFAADHVHEQAEHLEHITNEELRLRLADLTPADALDPHNRPIPPSPGSPPQT